MAAIISTGAELFHRFHTCEMYVKQGKIATCLLAFKQIIESIHAIRLSDKEKKEFNDALEEFLKKLCSHKKFKEIFGELSLGEADLKTNLEFMKNMIVAQEEAIVKKVEKDEAAAEAQRINMEKMEQKKKEEFDQKVDEAIRLINENELSKAMAVIGDSEEMRGKIIRHFNDGGIQMREAKDFVQAVKYYKKALSLSPNDENLHYNIGRAYYEQNRLDKAEDYLGKALKINPGFSEGKLFYEYLHKFKKSQDSAAAPGNGEKIGGFWQKLFSFRR